MRTLILALTLAVTGRATAQAERYELGRRLQRFEADWERADAAGRTRALAVLKPVSRQFLTFQLGDAGRTLDETAWALRVEPPTAAERWAAGLQVGPAARLVEASAAEAVVEVKPFYRSGVGVPVQATFAVVDSPVRAAVEKVPLTLRVPLKPLPPGASADEAVTVALAWGGPVRPDFTFTLSRVADLKARVAKLPAVGAADSLERATAADRAKLFADLAAGEVPESDVPAAALLAEAEGWADGRPYFTAARPGRFWLTVPAGGRKTPCRVFVPPNLDPAKPVPVVVALHGAGGSENLFFDGYGAGCVVTECEKRGWLMVSPRIGFALLGGGTPPLGDVINKLADRYPIDPKRVMLVGHSMGAAQAVEAVQRTPGAFAAVAALGGGGRVRDAKAFEGRPTFVGVGAEDFARGGAAGLHKALADAGVKGVTFREYPGVEHLTVVRAAVGDVFGVFDAAAVGKK